MLFGIFHWNNCTFSILGQNVYGRVLWHPSQDLTSAYQIQIEKVFICAGLDGYIPAYDPNGEEYGEGPQFGCIQPNKKLKHRLIILVCNYENEIVMSTNFSYNQFICFHNEILSTSMPFPALLSNYTLSFKTYNLLFPNRTVATIATQSS